MKILAIVFLVGLSLLGTGAVAAFANENNHGRTPVGLWEPPNGENRWEITVCGDRGSICAQLVWIRDDKSNKRNKKYIGRYLFKELPLVGSYKWRGPVTVEGNTVTGTITQQEDDVIVVRACVLILCADTEILRVFPEVEETGADS